MNSIKVSIICNTYNHENYIEKTLLGFLNQKTNFKFEVLIHDDASTDNTVQIIKKYVDSYPDVFFPIYENVNQLSKGVPVTYQYQYSRSRGEYIAYCEGDDYWIDDLKLQKQVDFLDNNLNYIACVHRYVVVDQNNIEKDVRTFGTYDAAGIYTFKDFFSNELPSQLASLVCRNIFMDKRIGYPKEFLSVKLQGDIILFLYLLTHGDIYRMDDVMSAYRFIYDINGSSWSSSLLKSPKQYGFWNGLRNLEDVYFKVYNKHINLKDRKNKSAVGVFADFKRFPSFRAFQNILIVFFSQPSCIFYILCYLHDKIKRKLGK